MDSGATMPDGLTTEQLDAPTAALIREAIRTRGHEIPKEARRIIGRDGEVDLAGIQIDVGDKAAAAAKSVKARAFSISRHIVFGGSEFCPSSAAGLWLLAHEIAHAVHQLDAQAMEYSVGPVDSIWEWCANAFARSVWGDTSQAKSCLQRHPVAPIGLILRHNGPECPGLPRWVPFPAGAPEVWLTANNAIELSYKASHAGHVMIFGGDFRTGETITLPRDAKLSEIDKQFGNKLLLELNGLRWQLRPDIIDFTERKFYEIKTEAYASANPAQVIDQLANYYRITEAIRVKYGGPEWNAEAPDWYPPHVLPYDSEPTKLVCTSSTQYKTGKENLNSLNRPGLILYKVLQRIGSDEERKKRAKSMRITDIAPELTSVRSFLENQLHSAVRDVEDREYLLVCTREFMDSVLIPKGQANIARVLSLLNVPALSIYQNPVVMLRLLGWSTIAVGELLYFIVAAQLVLLPEETAAASGVAAGTGTTLVLEKVPEAIIGGMKAANDVVALKEAAGVLLVIGATKTASAQAARIAVDRLGSVRAIPLHSTWGLGQLATGMKLDWAGSEYFYLGRALSTI